MFSRKNYFVKIFFKKNVITGVSHFLDFAICRFACFLKCTHNHKINNLLVICRHEQNTETHKSGRTSWKMKVSQCLFVWNFTLYTSFLPEIYVVFCFTYFYTFCLCYLKQPWRKMLNFYLRLLREYSSRSLMLSSVFLVIIFNWIILKTHDVPLFKSPCVFSGRVKHCHFFIFSQFMDPSALDWLCIKVVVCIIEQRRLRHKI